MNSKRIALAALLCLWASLAQAATLYVRSTDGSDSDDGSTWALAKASLAGAFTAASAGDTIWISQVHAEATGTSVTLTSPGTAASPCLVLCGNDAAEPPTALATTASVQSTGSGFMAFSGFAYTYGVNYIAGSNSSGNSHNFQAITPFWWRLDNCVLRISSTNAGSRINFGAANNATDDARVELIDCTIRFAASGQGIAVRCPFVWRGGSVSSSGTANTTLFLTPSTGNGSTTEVNGVDLSFITSNLVDVGQGNLNTYRFENCKLGSGVTVATGTTAGQGGTTVDLVNCDSTNTNYRYFKSRYQGTVTQEATIIRSGGSSKSRKAVTSANASFVSPLILDPILVQNATTGSSKTVTFEVVTDNVTLTDGEAWIRVEYLGSSATPLASFATDRKTDILASAANQTTSSATWTTTGLTTPVKQQLSTSFTPQMAGPIRAWVEIAKASTTVYVDLKPTVQ